MAEDGKGARTLRERAWEAVRGLSSLASTAAILVLTYVVTERPEHRLKTREMGIAEAQAMKDFSVALAKSSDEAERISTSLVLGTYGAVAGPVLVGTLEIPLHEMGRCPSVQEGLRLLATTDREEVCRLLSQVVDSRTPMWKWRTHTCLLPLLRAFDCKAWRTSVARYAEGIWRPKDDAQHARALRLMRSRTRDDVKEDALAAVQRELESLLGEESGTEVVARRSGSEP
jgi:hypothetical protein